jgi:hypothetical protein
LGSFCGFFSGGEYAGVYFHDVAAGCRVRFEFAWVPSMRSLRDAVGDASALAQGLVDGRREDG